MKPGAEAVRRIILEVCAKHNLTVATIRTRRRIRAVAWPRQEVMARAVNETRASYQTIALELGLTNHSTVIYGAEAYVKRSAASPISSLSTDC